MTPFTRCALTGVPLPISIMSAKPCAAPTPCELEHLYGIESVQFINKLSDSHRCPCARLPEQEATAVDGGASRDASDAVSWMKLRPRLRVVAFEPLPRNCVEARRKLAPFGARARLTCSALAANAGTAAFLDRGAATLGSLQGSVGTLAGYEDTRSGRVDVTTLDAVLGNCVGPCKPIFLVKLDLQGSEVAALRGATKLLRAQRIAWIYAEFDPNLLRGAGTSSTELLQLLEQHGFACHNFRERSWRPWNWYLSPLNESTFWTNILCGHRSVAFTKAADWKGRLRQSYCALQKGKLGRLECGQSTHTHF